MSIPSNRRVPAPMARLAPIVVLALTALLMIASSASASSGGIGTGDPQKGGAYHDAKLVHGKAIAPAGAPARVKRAIAYANRIRKTNYVWGGGHASFESKGYDCSGAVSYMLHGAQMLRAPMASGPLESWGKGGKGKWITVYANSGHAYAEIAGLRWDTSGGPGPRWHRAGRSNAGFVVRHYKGF
jgi:hypothetical protein